MNRRSALVAAGAIVVLAAIVSGARNPSQRGSSQPRWEYRIVSYAWLSGIYSREDAADRVRSVQDQEALNDVVARRMNDLGEQGWEVVCFYERSGFIFKRQTP